MADLQSGSVLFEPELVVRNDNDARLLLVLWCMRKAFFPMLLTGLIAAAVWFEVVARDPSRFLDRIEQIGDPSSIVGAVLSPFVMVSVAIGMRIVVAIAGLVAAFPFAATNGPSDYGEVGPLGRQIRTWWDRWKVSQAYRAYRWTWAVHRVVLDRLDARASIWDRWDGIMATLNVVLGIGFFVLLWAITAQAQLNALTP